MTRNIQFKEGDLVTLDYYPTHRKPAVKEFIGKECKVVKITKGGLVQISLIDNPKLTVSIEPLDLRMVE